MECVKIVWLFGCIKIFQSGKGSQCKSGRLHCSVSMEIYEKMNENQSHVSLSPSNWIFRTETSVAEMKATSSG